MDSLGVSASPPLNSPWNSPVPYLFAGLAAMLGLIAFALLILACSYWKFSGHLETVPEGEGDLETGQDEGESDGVASAPPVMEEKFLVIMAGQEKPTYLATPMSSRTSSFGSKSFGSKSICSIASSSESSTMSLEEYCEEKNENSRQIEMGRIREAHEGASN